jgi:hypothetical protein
VINDHDADKITQMLVKLFVPNAGMAIAPKNEESNPQQRRRVGGLVKASPAGVLADSDSVHSECDYCKTLVLLRHVIIFRENITS